MAASDGGVSKLDGVPDVDIDDGRFKYILIKVKDKDSKNIFKHIVRGYMRAAYHVDIFEEVESKLLKLGLKAECLGGGRIEHNAEEKTILVYGYSQGYGRANHSVATELLAKHYPDYKSITWCDEGY